MSTSEFDYSFKVILLGDPRVGKTTLVKQLSNQNNSNVGNCCCYSFTPNSNVDLEFKCLGKRVSAKIIDTGGQERYRSMTTSYFRGTDGCLLMFDVNNAETFEHIISWYDTLSDQNLCRQFTPVIVAAITKTTGSHSVPEARIQKMAEHLNLQYLYMDLRNPESIVKVLDEVINVMVRKCSSGGRSISMDLSQNSVQLEGEVKKFKCVCT